MGLRFIVLLLALEVCGCGSYFTSVGHNAATGALDAVTSDDAKKKLAGLTTDATKAAREEALGSTTDAELQKLVSDTGASARAQLNDLITDALREKIRQTIRMAIDEALGKYTLKEADAFREELVGLPLQRDLDALIDAAAPHLASATKQAVDQALRGAVQTTVTPLKADVDAEAAKWRPVAIGFAIGCGCLVVCLIFAVILIRGHKRLLDAHQRVIDALLAHTKFTRS